MIFSDIELAVLNHEVDAGVIIHENRFTYEAKGLKKICDLGELWEEETGYPSPLGGIVIKKSLPENIKDAVDQLIRKSIEYAFSNPQSGKEYIKATSQEMEDDVIQKHITTYVNNYSIDLGNEGHKAVEIFLEKVFNQKPEIINHKS
jgi:1,4-dihydroxy-6-naphthoate synthase